MEIKSQINNKENTHKLYTADEMIKEDGVYKIYKDSSFSHLFFVSRNGYILTNDWPPIKITSSVAGSWRNFKFYKTESEVIVTFKN